MITNETLAPYFSDFVTFKKRRGIDIGLVTVEDIYDNYIGDQTSGIYDEAGKIRKYLTEAYSDHTVWVLLGGDDTVIPVRYGAASNNTNSWDYIIPTDLYYAELNGDWNVDNDTYDPILAPPALQGQGRYGEPYPYDSPQYQSELFLGRLAVSTQAEIENWFDKYLLYCTNPNNGDYDYLSHSKTSFTVFNLQFTSKTSFTFTPWGEPIFNGIYLAPHRLHPIYGNIIWKSLDQPVI